MSERPILVTGAAGFIGRQVVARLAQTGRALRLLDLQVDRDLAAGHQIFEGSVADPHLVERACRGAGGIIHLAHLIDIDGSRPFDSVSVNIVGTANVFRSALEIDIRRVVWASSVMTYGALPDGSAAAEDHVQAPATFYGAGKLYLEQLGRSCRRRGLETVGLRMTTVFGPGRDRGGAAPFVVELFQEPAAGRPVSLAEGDRRVDAVYGPDAARACILALDAPLPLAAAYNVGGFSARVRDLADEVRRHVPLASIEVLPGGTNPWPEAVDCSAALRDFGYAPEFGLAEAVPHYLASLREGLRPAASRSTKENNK